MYRRNKLKRCPSILLATDKTGLLKFRTSSEGDSGNGLQYLFVVDTKVYHYNNKQNDTCFGIALTSTHDVTVGSVTSSNALANLNRNIKLYELDKQDPCGESLKELWKFISCKHVRLFILSRHKRI